MHARYEKCVVVIIHLFQINNGTRTEWSPIRSVIIRVITKSDDCAAEVQFVYHEYDFRIGRHEVLFYISVCWFDFYVF